MNLLRFSLSAKPVLKPQRRPKPGVARSAVPSVVPVEGNLLPETGPGEPNGSPLLCVLCALCERTVLRPSEIHPRSIPYTPLEVRPGL